MHQLKMGHKDKGILVQLRVTIRIMYLHFDSLC